jgi:small subunit ribosomal protein S18
MIAVPRFHSIEIRIECSETPMRVWSGEGTTYLRGNTMADETTSTHSEQHTPAARPSGPGSGPGAPRSPRPAGGPGGGPGGRKFFRRKKVCKFCTEKIDAISYRDVRLLQGFVAERGKIVPRRLTGVCTRHQRRLSLAIKQSRNIALLAFAARF